MPINDQRNQDELAEVFATSDPTQIQIARDMLEGSGIECFVFDRESSHSLGLTSAIPMRLMVHADAATEAASRLKELGFTE